MRKRLSILGLVILLVTGFTLPTYAISQGDINSIINNTAFYDPSQTGCSSSDSSGTSGTPLTGSDNEQQIFNYFVAKGLTAIQAAAIDGNFKQESGDNPDDGGGYLGQWSGGRLTNLQTLAIKENKPITDLGVQLDFVWQELTQSYSTVLQNLRGDTDIVSATTDFMGPNPAPFSGYPDAVSGGYENPGIPQTANRIMYAQQALTLYGGSAANSGTSLNTSDGCSSSAIVCNSTNPTATDTSDGTTTDSLRQKVVCFTQQQLAMWKSQPGYGSTYPNFPYAKTGYLAYSQGRSEEWCADFVSWVYNSAGKPLQSGDWDVGGVSSIQTIGETDTTDFTWHPQSSGYVPQPGDIAIQIAAGVSHVNIFISSSGGTATYIGGDQAPGPYPGGSIVSTELGSGYYDNNIIGYISPNTQ